MSNNNKELKKYKESDYQYLFLTQIMQYDIFGCQLFPIDVFRLIRIANAAEELSAETIIRDKF